MKNRRLILLPLITGAEPKIKNANPQLAARLLLAKLVLNSISSLIVAADEYHYKCFLLLEESTNE